MGVQVTPQLDQLGGEHARSQPGPDEGGRGHNGQDYRSAAASVGARPNLRALSSASALLGDQPTSFTRDWTSITGMLVTADIVFGSRSPPGPTLLVHAACQAVVASTGNPSS